MIFLLYRLNVIVYRTFRFLCLPLKGKIAKLYYANLFSGFGA